MRYVMKQKAWSWSSEFVIKDETGADHFVVRGQALSFGDKLSFKDMAGNELAFIRQKLFSWGSTYELIRGAETAIVSKAWTFFKDRFAVDVTADGPSPDDLELTGNFRDRKYEFVRDGQVIARVSKEWFTWADTYGVDIPEGEDDVLVLACTVVVDLCIAKQRQS